MPDFSPFSDKKLDQFIASGQLKHEHDAAIAERQRRQSILLERQAQERHKALIETISSQKSTNNSSNDYWYKKPIGIIILAVIGGVLIAFIKYVFGI